jgi:hypothetical protein
VTTKDVLPLERTAAAVMAAHASDAGELRRRRRRFAWLFGVIAALIVVADLSLYAGTQTVHVTKRREVEIRSLSRIEGMYRRIGTHRQELGSALVVRYFSTEQGAQAQGLERLDVFEWARPRAERGGMRVIVLSRQQPMLTRLLPLFHADIYPFRQKPDGTWGGLFSDFSKDSWTIGADPARTGLPQHTQRPTNAVAHP